MKKLRILIGNHHLQDLGGSETFTYTIAEELVRLGHFVSYFTFYKGFVSQKIEDLGVSFYDLRKPSDQRFDLALLSHQTLFRLPVPATLVVQTCHGLNHPLEQPSVHADRIVAISERIKERLALKGYLSTVIPNGINCDRFAPEKPIKPTLTSVLSLCQGNDANALVKQACQGINVHFLSFNKTSERVWEIEEKINQVDLVVTLGRGAYEAMACGRNVLVYDHRIGYEAYGEGMITPSTIEAICRHNCSGSLYKKEFNVAQLTRELQQYNPKWGDENRQYALSHFNVQDTVSTYLSLKPLRRTERILKRCRIVRNYALNFLYQYLVLCFDEYEGYYRIKNGLKNRIEPDSPLNKLRIKMAIRKRKMVFHRFELGHK